MARMRTGRPNGRPTLSLARKDKGDKVDLHIHIPVDLAEKIDRMRQGAETRKDVIVRVLSEYAE